MVKDFLVQIPPMQSRPNFEIPKKFEFKHFPKLIDLSVIQSMAIFLKENAVNTLKFSKI